MLNISGRLHVFKLYIYILEKQKEIARIICYNYMTEEENTPL